MSNQPFIEVVAVLAKFTDGKTRQVMISHHTGVQILSMIAYLEGKITVLEEGVETIEIEQYEDEL
jgi:hypothetical protein